MIGVEYYRPENRVKQQDKKPVIVNDEIAQMIRSNNLSVIGANEEIDDERGTFTVYVKVTGLGEDQNLRTLEDIGVCPFQKGNAQSLASARMKAWSKARRRAVLAFLGHSLDYV